MAASVTYSPRTEEWTIRGEQRRCGIHGQVVFAEEDLRHVRAVDLKAALAARRRNYGSPIEEAEVSATPAEYLDADDGGGPISFELHGGDLVVAVLHFGDWPPDSDERAHVESLSRLVEPLLVRHGASMHSVSIEDGWSGPVDLAARIRVYVRWRGRNLDELFSVGEDVLRLCDSLASGNITRDAVADLVRGGCAKLLIGQPEGNWLDAKSEEYDLTTTKGRISLAQAVARFANAEDGGLIVIGAKAKKIPGGELIREVRGVAPRQYDTQARYLRVLDQHLYPPVYGLRIDIVPTEDGRALVAVDIPPQPEELKPFLVHGAITADGETEGAFISIVQRRGEGSIPITAPMIHSTLAAGRALLRGRPQNHES